MSPSKDGSPSLWGHPIPPEVWIVLADRKEEKPSGMLSMQYPSDEEVQSLITDYERDFGATLPFKDARRMLVLYDELATLFEKYRGAEEQSELALPRLPEKA